MISKDQNKRVRNNNLKYIKATFIKVGHIILVMNLSLKVETISFLLSHAYVESCLTPLILSVHNFPKFAPRLRSCHIGKSKD